MLSCDSSGYWTQRKSGHTGGRDKVSLRSEFSYESSSFLTERRTLDTWSRSITSCHCAFLGASLGYWTRRKICHKRCRERAVLQYGSGDVTLSLKCKKTTSDKLCSQKASLPNESGCEPLVDWGRGRSYHTLGRGGPWSSEGWDLLVKVRQNNRWDTDS